MGRGGQRVLTSTLSGKGKESKIATRQRQNTLILAWKVGVPSLTYGTSTVHILLYLRKYATECYSGVAKAMAFLDRKHYVHK